MDEAGDRGPQRDWPEEQLAATGLRRIKSRHVTLYTDIPADEHVDVLPEIFDEALPKWSEYFQADPELTTDWRLNAFLMRDQEPFRALDMLPGDREITTGFATKENLWIMDQSTPYYRRHLWLHEGTHAFMHAVMNRTSPAWYMEAMAELLATHRWTPGELQLGVMPRLPSQVQALGRIELVQHDVERGRVHAIEDVMKLDNRRALPPEAYAWCWALGKFLDSHPRYRERFRTLTHTAHDHAFDDRFRALFAAEWDELQCEWAVFATTLSYNHQIDPTTIDFTPGDRYVKADQSIAAQIRADRGWQNTDVILEAEKTYRILAQGRYQVDDQPQIWWCEPDGVTIHYNRGKPLGILLASLLTRDQEGRPEAASFARAITIGSELLVTPKSSGTLYLRINDSPGSLHNNQGVLTISVILDP